MKTIEIIKIKGDSIRNKMVESGAENWSDSEIVRCLGGCVAGKKLISIAKKMREYKLTGERHGI